ncbi:MAG: hypothetical protein IH613_00890 [Desulfuromonadales bacterium]|nr:hypothetical protein [Desulfuromonadales bacterium]
MVAVRMTRRLHEGDDEQDSDPRQATVNKGGKKKELGVASGEVEEILVLFTKTQVFGNDQIQAAPHVKMGDEHMGHCNCGNEDAATDLREIPHGIIQSALRWDFASSFKITAQRKNFM